MRYATTATTHNHDNRNHLDDWPQFCVCEKSVGGATDTHSFLKVGMHVDL